MSRGFGLGRTTYEEQFLRWQRRKVELSESEMKERLIGNLSFEFALTQYSCSNFCMDEIEFTLNYLPKTPNSLLRQSYWIVKKEKDTIHCLVKANLLQIPETPWERVKLLLVRQSSSQCDYDGLVSSFKYVVDALVKCGIMVDDSYVVTGQWECLWQKVKRNQGKIYVKVLNVRE